MRPVPRRIEIVLVSVLVLASVLAGAAEAGRPRPIQRRFRLPPRGPAAERFAAMGDVGHWPAAQRAVAGALEGRHAGRPFSRVLLLGDVAPPERSLEDAADRPYRGLRARGVRFWAVPGNHDVRGGAQRGRELLRFLGVRARKRVRLAKDVDAFGIDTTLFQKGSEELYGPDVERLRAREIAWLDGALKKSGARFKVVYGHHAMYTSVRGGDPGQTDPLRAAIEPVLEKRGVSLYLAGHYHYYERTAPIRGVTHLVLGGGGAQLVHPDARAPHPREAMAREHHAVLFERTAEGLAFETVSAAGEMLDRGVIQ